MITDKPALKSKGKLGAIILMAYAVTAALAKLVLGVDVITWGDALTTFAEGLAVFGIRDALPHILTVLADKQRRG